MRNWIIGIFVDTDIQIFSTAAAAIDFASIFILCHSSDLFDFFFSSTFIWIQTHKCALSQWIEWMFVFAVFCALFSAAIFASSLYTLIEITKKSNNTLHHDVFQIEWLIPQQMLMCTKRTLCPTD